MDEDTDGAIRALAMDTYRAAKLACAEQLLSLLKPKPKPRTKPAC